MARRKNSESIGNDSEFGDNYVEEPDFSDPEDFVDDIDEEDLLGDVLQHRPKETGGFDSIIVVDGIPQVVKEEKKAGSDTKTRLDKLQNIIKKLYNSYGTITNEYWPIDSNNKTKGYVFFEYKRPEQAAEAVKATNGHKLDKTHTFTVNLLTDFEKYAGITESWQPPEPQPYPDLGNLHYFLEDADCFNQYAVLFEAGMSSAIYSNSLPEPTLIEERKMWTEKYMKWSPLGTYLTTLHTKGVALWGGEKFGQIKRFSHPGVEFIDFSPCEKYLVTFSPMAESHGQPGAHAIVVWEVLTGQEKRSFSADRSAAVWPALRWSHNDKYFARLQRVERKDGPVETISIYETPSCGLLDKKSLEVPGVRDFAWSPSDTVISYWVPEVNYGETPARVTLLKIPSREVIRTKNLFSVIDLKLHWQSSGEHLCVKVDRYNRAKKEKDDAIKYVGVHYNFEIFHLREKNVPVDSMEIKDKIMAFAWEPVGSKFAIVTAAGTTNNNNNVSFYCVKSGTEPALLKTLEKKACNHLFWSPRGQHIILAGLLNLNGVFEFVDTNDFTIMGASDHFMCTDVEWDPSGRYVFTAVSWWGHKIDNGFWLWTFQGRVVHRHNVARMCNVQWRPRPKTLLSEKQIRNIKKNLNKYGAQFDLKDKMRASRASRELIEGRQRLVKEFTEYRSRCVELWKQQKPQRLELRDGADTDSLSAGGEMEEESVELIVKKEVTVVP